LQEQNIEIIKKIKDRGISIIISEHRIELFKEVVDRFLYIDKGMLSKIWTRDEFEKFIIMRYLFNEKHYPKWNEH